MNRVHLRTVPLVVLLSFILVVTPIQPTFLEGVNDQTEDSVEPNDLELHTDKLAKVQLPFIENSGQVHEDVKFYANTFAGTVFVSDEGLTYTFINAASEADGSAEGTAVEEQFLTDKSIDPTGLEKSSAVVNYFIGNEEEKWYSNIPTYDTISLGKLWSFIDVELNAYGNNVEKIFNVHPGGNVGDIRLMLEGIRSLSINENGELLLETELGTVEMTKPMAYQEIGGNQKDVDISYILYADKDSSNTYGFEVLGDYNQRYTLFIDPLLASTFIGGSEADDLARSVVLDDSGNVFMTGLSSSPSYPVSTGTFDVSYNGRGDVIISKFTNDLTLLLASTFIGGGGNNEARAIAIDVTGDVFVTGFTRGIGFPTTTGAFDETRNGMNDVFVSKFTNDLTSLLASTLIGGAGSDVARAIAIDDSSNVFIAGEARAGDFPTTTGAFDESFNGGEEDLFVSKLSNDLTSLLASTFIGGIEDDYANAIGIDNSGNVFIAGYAEDDYPTTAGAFDETHNGYSDVTISKLDNDLTSLLASTYIGGSHIDVARGIAVEDSGNVFFSGFTNSNNYPTTSASFDEDHNGNYDVFVSKLNNDLTSLLASTFIGGSEFDWALANALDNSGNIFITGGGGTGYPTTASAFDETHNGSMDVIISKLNGDLSSLLASTFIGGSDLEETFAIAIDDSNVFVAGFTFSPSYPTTAGAFDETHNGSRDVIISKLTNDLLEMKDDLLEMTEGLTCLGLPVTMMGTPGDDVLIGTPDNDVIHGLEGNDRIEGRGGNDVICGDDGNDVLFGQGGDDTVLGGIGDDIIALGNGNDRAFGGEGNDRIYGQMGNDFLGGGPGDDGLNGNDGDDDLNGSDGMDRLNGGDGSDRCRNGEIFFGCELEIIGV